nr:nero [Cucujiformia]
YCLGQMQDENALNVLISVLKDEKQEPIVRHEAAEALGAIGSEITIPLLENHKKDDVKEVSETCELALDRIEYLRNLNENIQKESSYNSVDPAPPALTKDITLLKTTLIDENLKLFDRYRAMFALRNLGTSEAVETLGNALKYGSSLFKHEIAFVLGQMQNEISVPYLIGTLEDLDENEMVRHECAE